ncbi:MAG: polyprenyl synthetase family protein [Bacteroidia bacterium]
MSKLKALSKQFDEQIKELPLKGEPAQLYEPMSYIMELGGKRIRPAMVIAAYHLFKEKEDESVRKLALAVEMFHNFSLMHDDIMDGADLRRGQKSVHERWDTSTAILSGDLLLIKVYEMLASLDNTQIFSTFNTMATHLCEGQMMDMQFEEQATVEVEAYLEMIEKKTAVLLAFALESAGILGGADSEHQKKLYELGIHLGLSFQLIDDYLDAFGDAAKTGKKIGGDILEQKKTYMWNSMMLHLDENEQQQIFLSRNELEDDEYISYVKEQMIKTEAPVATRSLATYHHNEALEIFNEIKHLGDSSLLDEILHLLSSRSY